MPFAYYARLSPARQRTYRKSDAIGELALPRGIAAGADVDAIRASLALDRPTDVRRACQRLIDALVAGYRVPPIAVRVLATRPADNGGELHGLYEPGEDGERARLTVWMRTAQRKQVVAFRTFLRTLIHELCHHLDYELFALSETFHTDGFYKRESMLVAALLAQATPERSASGASAVSAVAPRAAATASPLPASSRPSRRRAP
jgi:hypothetical protein